MLFALATIPGAVVGADHDICTTRRTAFDLVFQLCMILPALFLLLRRETPLQPVAQPPLSHYVVRSVIEADGTQHTFSYDRRVGVGLSLAVGYFSSLLGIGGGIIHVPVMAHVLHFPVHIATATSHFTLAVMALTGTLVHIVTGAFHHGVRRTIALSLGVLVGAYKRRAILAPCAGAMDLAIVGGSPGVGRDTDPRTRVRLVLKTAEHLL
jgi:uncharacterized membrane protein YfcA